MEGFHSAALHDLDCRHQCRKKRCVSAKVGGGVGEGGEKGGACAQVPWQATRCPLFLLSSSLLDSFDSLSLFSPSLPLPRSVRQVRLCYGTLRRAATSRWVDWSGGGVRAQSGVRMFRRVHLVCACVCARWAGSERVYCWLLPVLIHGDGEFFFFVIFFSPWRVHGARDWLGG
jgi:hypothetical protein